MSLFPMTLKKSLTSINNFWTFLTPLTPNGYFFVIDAKQGDFPKICTFSDFKKHCALYILNPSYYLSLSNTI